MICIMHIKAKISLHKVICSIFNLMVTSLYLDYICTKMSSKIQIFSPSQDFMEPSSDSKQVILSFWLIGVELFYYRLPFSSSLITFTLLLSTFLSPWKVLRYHKILIGMGSIFGMYITTKYTFKTLQDPFEILKLPKFAGSLRILKIMKG